ncbi:LysR family transcriptional regulator [Shimia aestuarii]|uniref:LysR family transcriptional regulator n=1 Tax=Shimia aestuarii TaxID=254406 RepID=UPI001FB2DFB5|nr:LysR family transcriptional regulator [Shimia aestuarii]
MAIKIEMLRSFCAVAQAGNLADAADRLGRTQSAVSMTLKQLEMHLGSPLFEGERKNRLTPLGEQVLRLGQSQISQFDSTVSAIELSARAPQGLLRVSAVPSVASLAFPHLVRRMSAQHPGLRIELRDADTKQVLEALVQGWADIGIASSEHMLNGVATSLLFRDPFGIVLADRHPLAMRTTPLTIADVFSAPFLRNALCDQIETPAFRAALAGVDITVHNTQSLLAMVREGDWITVLPQLVTELAPEGLVFRPVADLPDMRQVFLYAREQTSSEEILSDAKRCLHDATSALAHTLA